MNSLTMNVMTWTTTVGQMVTEAGQLKETGEVLSLDRD